MFTLPELPYVSDALAPHLSARAMGLHHGKHHKAYVEKLNGLIQGTPLATLPLEEIVLCTAVTRYPGGGQIFNNAAQHWNHSFYWKCLSPTGGGQPEAGRLLTLIERDFRSFGQLRDQFLEKGTQHFGSGWVWLVSAAGTLEVMTTHDADTPIAHGKDALIACDLWEHAYYPDYENRRAEFLGRFLDNLADWRFAESNLQPIEAFVATSVAKDA